MNNTIEVLQGILREYEDEYFVTRQDGISPNIKALTKAIATLKEKEKIQRIMISCREEEIIYPNGEKWKVLIYKDNTKEECEWVDLQHFEVFRDALKTLESAGDMLPEKKRMPEIYGGECVERQKAGEFNKGIDLCQPILAKQILKNKELEAKINEFTTEYGEEITTAENLRLIDKDVDLLFRRIARSRIENKKLKERIEWWSDKCDDLNAETGELLLERDKLKEQQLTEDEIQMIVFRSGITLNKEEAYRIAKAIIKARKDKKGD